MKYSDRMCRDKNRLLAGSLLATVPMVALALAIGLKSNQSANELDWPDAQVQPAVVEHQPDAKYEAMVRVLVDELLQQ